MSIAFMVIIFITFLTFIASAIGTTSGFGTSTFMVPLLVSFLPMIEAIFLATIIHWFVNIWKIVLFHSGVNKMLLLLFGLPAFLGSYLGAYFIFTTDKQMLLRILGLFLLFYASFLLYKKKFKLSPHPIYAISGGALSGFFAGIFGIGGAIRSSFISAFDLPKATYIATLGAIGFIIDTTRMITYLYYGAALTKTLLYGLPLFIAFSFLGSYLGKIIIEKIPQRYFRTVVAVFLIIMGLKLLFFSTFSYLFR